MTATLIRRRLAERMGGWLDPERGIIRGAKLLGARSKNGRRYTDDAMREAVPKYEGAKVFYDHPASAELNEDRSLRDWVGVIHNPRYESSAIYGDIHLRMKSPLFDEITELVE